MIHFKIANFNIVKLRGNERLKNDSRIKHDSDIFTFLKKIISVTN